MIRKTAHSQNFNLLNVLPLESVCIHLCNAFPLNRKLAQAEAKKRKAQLQEANREKVIKRVERKMAAVARDRAWAEKLAELQRLEEEKKKKVMA